MFNIFFKNDTYKYEQLYKHIKEEIITGKIKANEKLPSKRKLALNLKISIVTIETAYNQLLAEGYIYNKAKVGFFVEQLNEHIKKNNPYIEQKEEKIKYQYDFKTNVVDDLAFPKDLWIKLMKDNLYNKKEILNEIHPQGLFSLRYNISKYVYQYRGITANPDQIIISSGTENLLAILIILLGNEIKIALEDPGYPKLYKLYEAYQIKTLPTVLDEDGMVINHECDVMHISPSHQFPTGKVMNIKRRLDILKWANENEKYIIEDDYDSEFRFTNQPIEALSALNSDWVIYLNSFTKSLSPTLRISFMILPNELLKLYQSKYKFFSCSVSNLEQYTLSDFMEKGYFEKHLNKMRKIYKTKRDYLINEINQSNLKNIFTINGSDAGLHLVLKGKVNEEEMVKKAINAGIRIYGLNEFCIYEKNENGLVMGYSHLTFDEIKNAISVLNEIWFKEL